MIWTHHPNFGVITLMTRMTTEKTKKHMSENQENQAQNLQIQNYHLSTIPELGRHAFSNQHVQNPKENKKHARKLPGLLGPNVCGMRMGDGE